LGLSGGILGIIFTAARIINGADIFTAVATKKISKGVSNRHSFGKSKGPQPQVIMSMDV